MQRFFVRIKKTPLRHPEKLVPCILKYVRPILKYVPCFFSLLQTPLKTAWQAGFGKPRKTPPFLSVSAMFPHRPSALHCRTKNSGEGRKFSVATVFIAKYVNFATAPTTPTLPGSGRVWAHICERRLHGALFLTL